MSFFSLRVRRQPLPGGTLILFLSVLLAAVPPAQAAPTAADVRFPTAKTVLWLGHTQIIPLRLKTATEAAATFPIAVADPDLAEIVRAPVFLAGEQMAYVRLHALRTGQTRLQIFGGPTLELDVIPDPAQAMDAVIDQESRRPQILSPMPGAAVWGEFNVGVSLFDDATTPGNGDSAAETSAAVPGAGAVAAARQVRLRLPDGRVLDPLNVTPASSGPEREYQFTVPAGLPAGALSLVAVASPSRTAGPAKPIESVPLTVEVKVPTRADLWAGECESPEVMGATKYLYAPARPANFGPEQPALGQDPNASGQVFIQSPSRGWCLPFIVTKAGDYQLILRSRAQFGGGAYPTMALYVNYTDEPQGLVRVVGSKYGRVPVGHPIYLDAGPQLLTVQFKNGFSGGKENRNLMLDSYEIAWVGEGSPPSTQPGLKAAPAPRPFVAGLTGGLHNQAAMAPVTELTGAVVPQLNILYPANGASVFGVDAVVAQATGDASAVTQVDVLLDGQLQHVALHPSPAGGGQLTFPLVLRGVPLGEHRLAVRATLASGEIVDAPARLLTVLPEAPAVRGPYNRAVWLLDRLAFGPEPAELGAVLTQGERKWLAGRLLASCNGSAADHAVLAAACAQYKHGDNSEQTVARVLDQWIETDNPVRARFTAWVENHFSTWMTKTKPAPQWDEHLAFCRLGIAPFSDLLEASAHSAAMLVYLDQEKSYAGKINENYAREIMELHTLGVHGGYKQGDVAELAQVLTGWTTDEEAALPLADPALRLVSDDRGNQVGLSHTFRFVPALNDGKARRVFGLRFSAAEPVARYDRIQLALEMLAAHPSTADHVCRKLAEHYVGVPAPDALVGRLAAKFLESGGDMRAVLFALVQDPDFWNAPPKMATPFDYGLRIARLCRAAALQANSPDGLSNQPELVEGFLKRSGMGLFDRVTPDGYPEDSEAYADSNALLQRWRFMQSRAKALTPLVPLAWRTPPPPPRPEDADLNHVAAPVINPAQRFVDLAAIRLTGRLLSSGSNQAALEVAAQGTPRDLEQALLFVSLLPETSLR